MARVSYTLPGSGELAWFDPDRATLVAQQETRWDGSDQVSAATGSPWVDEDLYRTAGGAWVVRVDSRDMRTRRGAGVFWEGMSAQAAQEWLRRQDLHEIADEHFGAVDERGPGRPAVGPAINTRVSADQLRRLDAWASARGLTRAEAIRRIVDSALGASEEADAR